MSRQSVAVVGAGVSGMTAAYLLQRRYDVTVFEANAYLGGNADTRNVTLSDGSEVPVDVAFMAYGEETYPNFKRLLAELDIASRPAQVAVDIVCTTCGFTHLAKKKSRGLSIPPQPPGVEPSRWARFITDLRRFPEDAREILTSNPGDAQSVQEFLGRRGYSDYFFQHFVYPRVAPWFLSDPGSVRVMSMRFLVNTLRKYGVLDRGLVAGWRVIVGGSRSYLRRIAEQLSVVLTRTDVRAICRTPTEVMIRDRANRLHAFDKAVVAVPPATALVLLADDATARERELLSAFRYTRMNVTLHTDPSVLPKTPAEHSGICMQVSCQDMGTAFRGCTINASLLQTLDTPQPVIISYNATDNIAPETVSSRSSYEHPVFTVEAFEAQRHLTELSGSRLAFAGSYFGSSLHEDGCASGVQAAEELGVPWD